MSRPTTAASRSSPRSPIPFPTGILQPTGASLGAQTYLGNAIGFFNPDPLAPRLLKYEIDIQRELPGRFVMSAGYLGSRGDDLEVSRSYKPFPNQYLSTSPVRDQTDDQLPERQPA